jgi:type IV secretion system protein VirD4
MLSKSNIQLNSIGEQKTAIFLIMPDEKTSYHKLISVFIKQSYEYLIYQAQNLPKKTMPVRINYILDEFSSLPTIKDFPSMIYAVRSRNIRFNLIVQSKHQLTQRYADEAETIQSNCLNLVFLTSRELSLLNDISALSGTRTGSNKPLISISELQRFNKEKGEVLVFSGRKRPFKGCLPDIDKYDENKFDVLDFPYNTATQDNALKRELENKIDSLLAVTKDILSW